MTTRRPLRIAEVARLAGVSTATVSRALTAPEKLRADTLARVTEAVRRTGYTPNSAARTLRARRTMLVLVVVPDIANPFFSDVLRGIDDGLSQHGYGFLIGNLGNSRSKEPQLANIALSGQVDGVLLLNGRIPQGGRHSLSAGDIPMVAVCEAIPGAPIPQVEVENRAAARRAVAHLAALGHRHIAYLAGPADNILEHERRTGFCEGLADAAIPRHDARFYPGDFTFDAGVVAAAEFLSLRQRPTAAFAANDEMAIGFVKRIRSDGLAVPDDISVVGFDGIEFADFVEPTLTTFRQPRRELGYYGASLLVQAMRGEAIDPARSHLRLPVPLLERGSTAPARCSDSAPCVPL
ncbi:MAG TPA: LacI family DNA-binding transcriptional regulator [Acetobacteraceae bacterium]|nr:LacI family DNA-binding transcriptional regulator [Acetobacteraceae bacterium]